MKEARFRRVVRGIAAGVLVLAGAALTGVVPWAPALTLVAALAAVFAAEGWLAARSRAASEAPSSGGATREALVDTSVLIDGRLADVCASGFLAFDLVVPGFVLRELQHIADSSDRDRRNRGRRGLDILQALRASDKVRVVLAEDDVPEQSEVDLKLVELARRRGAALVTTDFNLNKVASIRGVPVLNVNDLAHALRPALLPGETLSVTIVKEGKEAGQGVGYLADGTMIVVDQARSLIGQAVMVAVTGGLQTAAGKMYFGKLAD
jgi:uncharacterized protein YacL